MTKIEKRDIAMCVVLSIVTCGIYGWVWIYRMTEDAGFLTNDKEFSGTKAVLFGLLTCGIYNIYWAYKMGEKIEESKKKISLPVEDYATLYLILAVANYFCGITNLIMLCLAQSELNKIAEN